MKAAISQEMKTVIIELLMSEYNFLKTLSKKWDGNVKTQSRMVSSLNTKIIELTKLPFL